MKTILKITKEHITESHFLEEWPSLEVIQTHLNFHPEKILVIVDKNLKGKSFQKWIKQFKYIYSVEAGEKLKSSRTFFSHVQKISQLVGTIAPQNFLILAVGGGSIGDFSGFLASVFKRGVPLIHLPTTYLAALDSAHGGKTALNLDGFKNQIGTIYPASHVYIVKEALMSLPQRQLHSAMGEGLKMAILEGGDLLKTIKKIKSKEGSGLWEILPALVDSKNRFVEEDPFEQKGIRHALNLGHTFGHAVESQYELLHGEAVAIGTSFSVRWSAHRGYISAAKEAELLNLIHEENSFLKPQEFVKKHKPMSPKKLRTWIQADKKAAQSDQIFFIFLDEKENWRRIKVPIESLITEAGRQGWIKT